MRLALLLLAALGLILGALFARAMFGSGMASESAWRLWVDGEAVGV